MIFVPRFLIAAAHKSAGKTTISTGLARALSDRGLRVQTFKKGPDYIDPMWHDVATGRPSYNLDFNTQSHDEITDMVATRSQWSDVSLIEANKGLYDGVAPDGSDSNAALAKLLDVPVILVIDTVGMTRGIAPLLVGYRQFDPDVMIAGIILNKVGGPRHEAKLRRAVKDYTDIPVLGCVMRTRGLEIGERHLGLTTPRETGVQDDLMGRFGSVVGDAVDLDAVLSIARSAPDMPEPSAAPPDADTADLRIGIAMDTAFGFYYADDLEAFRRAGAELVPLDLIEDETLPELDGLFIGGGFPEARMHELAANETMRRQIHAAIEGGLSVYAECGGLMYLCKSIEWQGERAGMVGAIDAEVLMHRRPQGRGHIVLQADSHPWLTKGSTIKAHEFHYASLENLSGDTHFATEVRRGFGIDGAHDMIVKHNLVAGFCHMRQTGALDWVDQFVSFVRTNKKPRQN